VRSYVLRRLVQMPIVLLVLVTATFFLMRFAPGGPFSSEGRLDPVVLEALRARYHLDRPLWWQYGHYLWRLAHGDLGPSTKPNRAQTVNEIIGHALPVSLLLGSMALLVALAVGVGAGIVSALRHNTVLDYGTMAIAVLGISLPTFVFGPLLQLGVAFYAGWLPLAGYQGVTQPQYLVLPALTMALPFAARIARLMRAGMLDVLQQDFIRTARAKGLAEPAVVLRHALRGGILPVVSFIGPAVATLMTGSLVVEMIFQVPGLGWEFVQGALARDYTLVLGTVIVYGALLLVCNLVTDLLYGWLDPRVSYG
jgi:oligopeptide transport system permease protein